MFDHRGPQPSDVHPGGNRSITRGTVRFGADAGAHQLVFEGQLKNDRLPLGADTLKIIAQHHHRAVVRALRRCGL